MANPQPPRSPTLIVPRKSVELEDPGARDLDSSNDEDEVFTDAREGEAEPASPIPITRVEKVDNSPSHGDVPGTEAYDMRTQDAVPDEIAVVPEPSRNRPSPIEIRSPPAVTPPQSPIPMTRVEKVDPTSPSHGEVPGTPAHAKRKADAVPDSIVKVPEPGSPSFMDEPPSKEPKYQDVPRTVITRVDSEPKHGEVPGGRSESQFELMKPNPARVRSPIAEDGGFGPMNSEDEDEDEDDESEGDEDVDDNDYEEFTEETGVDDFGDFDDGFQKPEESRSQVPPQSTASGPPPFPVLDFASLSSLESITEAIAPHCAALFPSTTEPPPEPPEPLSETNSTFLTERSLSLWSQLVAPPPLQPPNWVRSRIRRLFLVSLGVPVDLDEILPKSKQKKLVLPYTSTESKHSRKGSSTRPKLESGDGAESRPSTPTAVKSNLRKRKGPPPPPDFDMVEVRILCSKTDADLESLSDEDLKAHVKRLDELLERGKEVLQYWIRRKEAAVGEKEAFDGVIENLVRHARKVRK